MKATSAVAFFLFFSSAQTVKAVEPNEPMKQTASREEEVKRESVRWIGEIQSDVPSHTKTHQLKFVKKEDGKTFDIINDETLRDLHSEEKPYVLELEGYLVSRPGWGDRRIEMISYKIISETQTTPMYRPFREGRERN